ncbi:AsmA family protein [Azospirillum doebereinerae]
MRTILIAAGAGLAVLAGGVLAAPSLIDWNAYKGTIAERVSAATGRTVELRGDIGLTLLPSPALTLRDARLANPAGAAEPDMARLKKLDARVALGPLLTGRIQVESVTLVEPVFVVEVLKDGRLNWDLSGGAPAASGRLPAADGFVSAVSFDRVTVENGTVVYRDDRSGRTETLDAVNAAVVAGSLTGPFQLQGDFHLRGLSLHAEVTAGRFTDGAAVPVRAALSMPGTDATLRFAGIVSGGTGNPGGSGALRAQGDLRAEGGDLARLFESKSFDPKTVPALAQPYSLRATVEAGTSLAVFSNLEAQLGDTRATGTATLRAGDPARTELTLAVNRLDLDAWLARASKGTAAPSARGPAATPANGAANGATNGGAAGTPARPATLALPFGALPVGIEAKLDLAVDGVTYNGGVVRQGRLEASLSDGRLNIDRISALLPGGSDFVAAGEMTTPGGQPTLDVRMEANADNLRALLDWMKLDVHTVPADRLRRASIAGRVQGHADRFELSGLDLRVDSSRLSGAIAYVDRGRPAFGARLELDRLNLDAYLPASGETPAPGPMPGPTPAPVPAKTATPAASASSGWSPQRVLGMADANLNIDIGQLTLRGLPMQGIHLDTTVAGGALTIREARIDDLVGLKGRVDGQIAGLSPLRGVNIALSAEADSLGGLPRAVPWPAGVPVPERLGAVTAKARLAGDADRLALELSAGMAGGTLEAGGALLALDRTPTADVKLRVTHPELGRIAALFTDRTQARAYGPLDLYGELGGTAKAPSLANLQGIVAGTAVRGKLAADLAGERPRLEANLQTGDLDIDRLIAAPLVGAAPGGDGSANTPPAQGGASTGGASAALAEADLHTADPSWLRAVDGRLSLTAASVTAGGARIEQPALRAGLANGILTLDQLDGEWLGGQIGLSGRVVATAGRVPSVEADVTLVKAALSEVAAGSGVTLTGGTVDLDLTLSSAGTSRDALLRGLAGRGRVAAAGGVLRGLDLGALRDRLAQVERPQEVLGAVAGSLQGGETRIDRLDGRVAIDHGVVRTDDTRLVAAAGEGVLTGLWSLPESRVDLGLSLRVKADPAPPPLTLRIAGPASAPTQTLDMQAVQEHFARAAAASSAAPPKP